ncbi:MAG: adenosylmethionine--8-amino-7-oxononanoate transaminase [Gammaproteobacteria bacterium]|nr:MAG: adenosylmethionine--8-amino-7-oxononanoate transaminase [Gammaproteobacteria bacterium]
MSNNFDEFDKQHIWHPYSSMSSPADNFKISRADGVYLFLEDGTALIDGMSSWWSAIWGYNHPILNLAIKKQLDKMAHVMFGGLTHQPAIDLAKNLIEINDKKLNKVFFADSGSVSVEVAIKMAMQYQISQDKPSKNKLLTIKGGYHGDTFGVMAVCDPINGMHNLFTGILPKHYFAPRPTKNGDNFVEFEKIIIKNHHKIAAVILEPLLQGTGGMWLYDKSYLKSVRNICDEYNILLILDEIATGFGRTGSMFAYQQCDIVPDILCVGKALTGGYMTLSATITTEKIAYGLKNLNNGVLNHGPTFMANPLACSVANASIKLLLDNDYQTKVQNISELLSQNLKKCQKLNQVSDVRIKGAVGIIELQQKVDLKTIQPEFVKHKVWIRPFGKLVYVMPPYIIKQHELDKLCDAIYKIISKL